MGRGAGKRRAKDHGRRGLQRKRMQKKMGTVGWGHGKGGCKKQGRGLWSKEKWLGTRERGLRGYRAGKRGLRGMGKGAV